MTNHSTGFFPTEARALTPGQCSLIASIAAAVCIVSGSVLTLLGFI